MQIERILVPTDFSPLSRLALDHGLAFARKFRARLMLLHVVELGDTVTLPETARSEQEQARRMLSALIEPEDQTGLDIRTIVKSGKVADEILSTGDEERADLIVLGTHGRGPIAHLLLGSVTQTVLQSVDVPVLTVTHVRRAPAFRRILFATDFSELSKEGSRYALQLAETTSASLIAVHAVVVGVEGGAEAGVYLSDSRMNESRAALEEFKATAGRGRIAIETVVSEGAAADVILKSAENKSADLIVITVRNTDSTKRTPLGPAAERIIREARVPVLAIPTLAEAPAEKGGAPTAA